MAPKPKKQLTMTRREMLSAPLKELHKNILELTGATPPQAIAPLPAHLLAEAAEAQLGGDLPGAVERYRDYIKADPNNADVRFALGKCLYALGQHIQARVEFERTLMLRKQDLLATAFLGLTLLRLGKRERAIHVWQGLGPDSENAVHQELIAQRDLLEQDPETDVLAVLARIEPILPADESPLAG